DRLRHQRVDRRAGRRRPVHRADDPLGAGRPRGLRAPDRDPAGGTRRPGTPRAADPRRLRGQERADPQGRGRAGCAAGGRRRGRGVRGRTGDERAGDGTGASVNGHLLSIHDVSAQEIVRILDTAESFREVGTRVIKKVPALRGRTVVNLFYENSTRTRISFELAAKRLSADVINFTTGGSSVSKGESLKDTALTLQAMGADAIVIRHSSSGSPHQLTKWVRGHVLNAGDGTHEHPTQALLDMYTMRERFGRLEGLRVAIVGDVLHSRVARSLSFGLVKMGADVTLVGPPTLIPPDAPAWGVQVSYDIESVLPKLDVTYVLRVQRERQRLEFFPSVREYSRLFGVTNARVGMLPEGALIMHPGPMNRGVEIDSDVADLPQSVIEEQVTNGIAVRMALLYLLLGGRGESPEGASDGSS